MTVQADIQPGDIKNGQRVVTTAVALSENTLTRVIGKRIQVTLHDGTVFRGVLAGNTKYGWKLYAANGPWNFSLAKTSSVGLFSH